MTVTRYLRRLWLLLGAVETAVGIAIVVEWATARMRLERVLR